MKWCKNDIVNNVRGVGCEALFSDLSSKSNTIIPLLPEAQ